MKSDNNLSMLVMLLYWVSVIRDVLNVHHLILDLAPSVSQDIVWLQLLTTSWLTAFLVFPIVKHVRQQTFQVVPLASQGPSYLVRHVQFVVLHAGLVTKHLQIIVLPAQAIRF